jgi:TP901 family phage tail tape measure protein
MQRSSNSAGQAEISLTELASYITVLSSVTRKSSESIGESFKTMFARMQNIKLGKLFEDDATDLNDVEKALHLVNIELRDSETSFRPLGDVIDDVAARWNTLNDIEQSAVANAIAGMF